jgi:RimJ/RimL family protein N-acetyltransferase
MFVGHWRQRGFGMWAVEEDSTGRFVGQVGLNFPEGWPDRELGWLLCRPFWGRGYATEAGRAAARYAFRELGWDHLISLILPGNRRSIRLARRLRESLHREVTIRGVEHLVYRMERSARNAREFKREVQRRRH